MTLNQRIALSRYYRHVAKHGIVGPVEQPIKDYAPTIGKDYAASQARRKPMARRDSNSPLLMFVACCLMLVIAGFAGWAKLVGG